MPSQIYALFSTYTNDPERGGNQYWHHIIEGLKGSFGVSMLTIDSLKLSQGPITPVRLLEAVRTRMQADGREAVVVQDTSFWRAAVPLNRWLRDHARVPVISFGQEDYVWRRRSWIDRWRRRRALRAYLNTCFGHIVVAGSMRDHYRQMGVRAPIEVVYPGSSVPSVREHLGSGGTRLRIVTAGVYTQAKGVDILIEAIGLLKRHHPHEYGQVEVDGYGTKDFDQRFVQRMETRVAALGLGERVHLHPSLAQAKLWDEFQQADVFAFLANGEGYALVITEAMANGCIPLLNVEGSGGEAVGPELGDLLVRQHPRSLMEAILRLIRGPDLRRDLRAKVLRRATETSRPWPVAARDFAVSVSRILTANV